MSRKYLKIYRYFTLSMLLLCIVILNGCKQGLRGNIQNSDTVSEQAIKTGETMVTAVIKSIDLERKVLSMINISNNEQITVTYTGATNIWSKNDAPLAMSQVSAGEIIDAVYAIETKELVTVQKNKESWERKEVKKFTIDKDESSIQVGKSKYQYNNDIFVCDADNTLYLIDVNQQDELTLRGIDTMVYSIEVTKGHGYIRFQGNRQFADGNLEIGDSIFMTVSENMLVAVQEGLQTVTMKKGKLKGSKEVTVIRNQEVTIDMSEFQEEPKTSNQVRFVITPDNAALYINQKKVDYSKAVILNYGDYTIRVKSDGYEDYTGVLTVGDSEEPVCIDLAPAEDSITGTTTTASPDRTKAPAVTAVPPSPTSTSSSLEDKIQEEIDNSTSVSNVKDTAHTISINSPKGAEVYVNGIYKGIAPTSFMKEIGKLTIKLSKRGYKTRSYNVEVADDSKDVTYGFSELEKE